ncbi:MopE-related protein [Myxococcota bacterium]
MLRILCMLLCTACTKGTIDAVDPIDGSPGDNDQRGDAPGGDAAAGDPTAGDPAGCIDVDRDAACVPIDCDDENAAVGPSQTETCANGLDDNCNGEVDEGCLGMNAFFVDRDSIGGTCDDNNDGTQTAPWCTIGEANGRLTAGQTVYIRAGTYLDETISPANSGTSDNARITYVAYANETVTLEQSVYCMRLQSRSYVTVLGLHFFNCGRNVYLDDSHHNNIGLCTFDNPAGPATWAGSRVYHASQYNRIFNCTFSRYGEQSGSNPDWDDHGCILDIGNDNEEDQSDFNTVVNSTFYYGGHHILGVYANHNVIRGNTFHNEEWFACHRTSIGGLCGGRDVITNSSQPDINKRNIFEDNIIAYAGVPPDQVSSAGLSLRTPYNIVRRNAFYSSDSSGVTLSADGGNHNDPSNNHIYNNVFYRNGYLLVDDWDPRKYGLMLARWNDDAQHNVMAGVAIKNNIFHENNHGAIYYYYVNEAEQVVANNWEEEGNPGFLTATGDPDPFDFAALELQLADGSPCINNGGFLTQATNAGDNSTDLQVIDAGYFFDGYDIVEPDMIQLEGQTVAVPIDAINYATNHITLAEPLSWNPDDGVSLPYHGVLPDQGIHEYRD